MLLSTGLAPLGQENLDEKFNYGDAFGYALGVYGHIRATNDLDIYINPTEENATKMVNACVDYGIPGIVRIYLS